MNNIEIVHQPRTAAPPPPRSAARTELAVAVARHSALVSDIAAIKTARQASAEATRQARAALDAAKASAEEVPTFAATATAASLNATAVRSTRAKLSDAQAQLAELTAQQPALEQRQREIEVRKPIAEMVLSNRVNAVVASEMPIDDMIADAARLREEYDAARALLKFAASCFPAGDPAEQRIGLALALPRLVMGVTHPAVVPWHAALDQLHTDADAPLPSAQP